MSFLPIVFGFAVGRLRLRSFIRLLVVLPPQAARIPAHGASREGRIIPNKIQVAAILVLGNAISYLFEIAIRFLFLVLRFKFRKGLRLIRPICSRLAFGLNFRKIIQVRALTNDFFPITFDQKAIKNEYFRI